MHLNSILRRLPIAIAALFVLTATACGGSSSGASGPVDVRLGYFANITHATALVGVANGTYGQELGSLGKLKTSTFNAGPAAVEALLSGAIDMSYVGPNPAVNAYVQSHGSAVRIISGATSGGASLVVKKSINSAADLKGKKLATPQLGGTQDVALRYWLGVNGLTTDSSGGGDVSILPQDNAQTLTTFQAGAIDGAWVPEPWATRLVQEGGGRVLVDERSLWPSGEFVSTVLLVRKDFLDAHPAQVKAILRAQVKTNRYLADHPTESQTAANAQILAITGKALKPATIAASWANLKFTNDPIASSLRSDVSHAQKEGLLKSTDIKNLFDLSLLNAVLKDAAEPAVKAT
ncbi:MAG: sulfonate transport system substrate-binding protein [Chloroflexota bacterium]|jgi:NitT/TauT family transport system substrate-binding protein|nr:sulfonate transport system substrate-binding protein [Chloroflexota bacterium]